MNYEELSPEVLEKAKACDTAEQLFALAKEEGVELSAEELEAISGGPLPFPDAGGGQSRWFRKKS